MEGGGFLHDNEPTICANLFGDVPTARLLPGDARHPKCRSIPRAAASLTISSVARTLEKAIYGRCNAGND